MNILLLLSALLSALTGGTVGGASTPVPAEQVAQATQVVAAVAVVQVAQRHVPAFTLDLLTPRLAVAPLVRLPVAGIPAFASRRRE